MLVANVIRRWISGHFCDAESNKDKLPMIINEHRKRIDWTERQDELTKEP